MANETEINQLTSEVAGLKTAAQAILDNAGGAAAANAEAAAAAKQAAEDANAAAQTIATAFGGVSTLDTIRDQTIAAAARTYDTLTAMLADTAVYPVGTRLSVRGGGTYKVVASGGDLQRGDGVHVDVVAEGSVLVSALGAVGDGTTDDTAAFQAANTAATRLGVDVATEYGVTYGCTSLSVTAGIVGGGTLLRTGGSGPFISTASNGLTFDVVLDCANIGTHGLQIRHDDCRTAPRFVVRNCANTGVDARDANNVAVLGAMFDCVQMGVFAMAQTQDVYGLYIDVTVDNSGLGTTNANGGVKVHGTATYRMLQPFLRARVKLHEGTDVNANQVCIETHTNCPGAVIEGETVGGNIGCTANGSEGAQVYVTARGAFLIGLESAESPRSVIRGSVLSGDIITSQFPVQLSGGDHGSLVDVSVSGCSSTTGASPSANSPVYVNGSDDVTVRGMLERTGGNQYGRIRGSANLRWEAKCRGSGVTRALLVDPSSGSCDGLTLIGAVFPTTTNGIQCAGTLSDLTIGDGTVIKNNELLITGSPTLTNMQISPRARVQTTGIATAVSKVEVLDFQQSAASLIRGYGTGSPEGTVTAKVGSTFIRTDGSSPVMYRKMSGTGATGWEGDKVDIVTNSNGVAYKYPDGRMTCEFEIAGVVVNTAAGAIYRSTGNNWTFPVAFISAPMVVSAQSSLSNYWCGMNTPTASAVYIQVYGYYSVASPTVTIRLRAEGFWK